MPKVVIDIPEDFFSSDHERETFFYRVQESVAWHMSCKDLDGNEVKLNPVKHIDVVLHPYTAETARPTAVLMVDIITYGLPDRMANINERVSGVANDIAGLVPIIQQPEGQARASVTFLAKGEGCWAEA